MSYVPYKSSDTHWYYRPEYAFRIGESGQSVDQTNTADSTWYPLPIRITADQNVYVRKRKRWEKYNTQSRFERIEALGFENIEITFVGPVLNYSWLGFLTDQITHTGTEAPFTHESVSSAAITNPPRTIQLLRVTRNDKTDETEIKLYTGVIVKKYTESAETNQQINGEWELEASNEVDGTALTEYPSSGDEAFVFAAATLTYTKSSTQYQGILKGYEFVYETDKSLARGGTSFYPVAPYSPNKTVATLSLKIEVWDKSRLEACEDDVESAQSKTITLKNQRSANDYFQIAFAKAYTILKEIPLFEDGNLRAEIETGMNLKESGALLTLTEVNAIAGTRY